MYEQMEPRGSSETETVVPYELPCPDCGHALNQHTNGFPPWFDVECPDCGYTDEYVAG